VIVRIKRDIKILFCPKKMYRSIKWSRSIKGQLANPGSTGKWPLEGVFVVVSFIAGFCLL